ncbi:DUF222 domain-containing protein [Georgenia sp. 10Sc9-8]|uniref:DUF222 domain-containing protein n=1 Tax=Georgenia halotolerans TaxID=3028317 RepID=A0ABT5U174_9MICO|nr:DUF222 domain-containing protein [Georgenia halotolerans]
MDEHRLVDALELLERAATTLAELDTHGARAPAVTDALTRMEAVEARLYAARAHLLTTAETDGLWATTGARSFTAWVRMLTGRFNGEAARLVRNARALRDHLPAVDQALTAGHTGPDQVTAIVRAAVSSPGCLAALNHPVIGEAYLAAQACVLDGGRMNVLMKNWATKADPGAADRRWRADSDREELVLARTLDGWHVQGWLDATNGELLRMAVDTRSPRAKDDDRSQAQRRAAGLTALAGAALDSGALRPHARIRPHLAVTVPLPTLLALAGAQQPVTDGPGTGSPDRTINGSLDHQLLGDTEPATLADGTAVSPALLAKLACDSALHRVIFSTDSEILDVGREKRLFTTGQTRGILARDRHCQYPECTAPPGEGEIHHSLYWYLHKGSTSIDNGVLLCHYHHQYVHQHQLTIERHPHAWLFLNTDGTSRGTTTIPGPVAPQPAPV